MSKENTTLENLVIEANNISCLAIALDKYSYENFSSAKEVTLDGLNGLKGIVSALVMMTAKHADDIADFNEDF